ncbi:MAG: trehalose-6-phosphate synthase [bacterium]|nr:trehalose-6-phosphate synthase [bacterium]
MDIKNKRFVMISNRGPNFTSNNTLHRGMGGTKEIYARLVENFCKGWICLASSELKSDSVQSEYRAVLKILFIEKDKYANYYYKYVSEYLYPSLLGYPEKANPNHSPEDFNDICKDIVECVKDTYGQTDVMICDYHLFKIPSLIDWDCKKIFLWFIPILTEEYYTHEMKEIVWSLAQCDEIYFFNEIWSYNFKKAFNHYYPDEPLKTKVRSLMMGPDEDYTLTENISRETYVELLSNKLSLQNIHGKKYLLSVSRMDFVKNIPLSIQGFEKYLEGNPEDSQLDLILIAPHHRKDSDVYIAETTKIKTLVEQSKFRDRIHLTHEYFNADELRILFKFANAFVCPSTFDAVPLTPLEYVLANENDGAVILSDSIGAYMLVFPNCYDFHHEDVDSLAQAIKKSMHDSTEMRQERMQIMKSVIMEESLQKSMEKLKTYLNNV